SVRSFFRISFLFFSSRRRHTRSKRDWSSDVCSSDLGPDPDHGTMVASLLAGHGDGDPPDDEEDEDADDDSDDSDDEAQDDVAPIDQYGTDGILGAAPKVELLSVCVRLADTVEGVPSGDEQIANGANWLADQ